jgi:hypothetical protein
MPVPGVMVEGRKQVCFACIVGGTCLPGGVHQFDAAALTLLREVAAEWESGGPLGVLRELTGRVWWQDVDRYREDLGDDATTLGVQASRNICNLGVRALRDLPGVVARDVRTLEVEFAGRTLHISKAPPEVQDWHPTRIDWSTSEVRDVAARANSGRYQPVEGTLFEFTGPMAGQGTDPARLPYLHYVWLGHADGTIHDWLGFPRLEPPSWFALLDLGTGDDGTAVPPAAPPRQVTAPTRPTPGDGEPASVLL